MDLPLDSKAVLISAKSLAASQGRSSSSNISRSSSRAASSSVRNFPYAAGAGVLRPAPDQLRSSDRERGLVRHGPGLRLHHGLAGRRQRHLCGRGIDGHRFALRAALQWCRAGIARPGSLEQPVKARLPGRGCPGGGAQGDHDLSAPTAALQSPFGRCERVVPALTNLPCPRERRDLPVLRLAGTLDLEHLARGHASRANKFSPPTYSTEQVFREHPVSVWIAPPTLCGRNRLRHSA